MSQGAMTLGWNGYKVDLSYSVGFGRGQIALMGVQPPSGYRLAKDVPMVSEHLIEQENMLIKIRVKTYPDDRASCEILSIRELKEN